MCLIVNSLTLFQDRKGDLQSMEDTNKITREGLIQYEDELHDLKVNRRQEIAQKIKEAREQGDLSENAEYDAAKDEQGRIEDRIAELEELLKNAEIIPGTFVKVKDVETGEVIDYKIVGSAQADSLNNMISDESPVGRALKDSKKGETVKVETPAGVLQYKVKEIWKD
jgi:transcription elongation factor GreA